jgi:hypothetical protein
MTFVTGLEVQDQIAEYFSQLFSIRSAAEKYLYKNGFDKYLGCPSNDAADLIVTGLKLKSIHTEISEHPRNEFLKQTQMNLLSRLNKKVSEIVKKAYQSELSSGRTSNISSKEFYQKAQICLWLLFIFDPVDTTYEDVFLKERSFPDSFCQAYKDFIATLNARNPPRPRSNSSSDESFVMGAIGDKFNNKKLDLLLLTKEPPEVYLRRPKNAADVEFGNLILTKLDHMP